MARDSSSAAGLDAGARLGGLDVGAGLDTTTQPRGVGIAMARESTSAVGLDIGTGLDVSPPDDCAPAWGVTRIGAA